MLGGMQSTNVAALYAGSNYAIPNGAKWGLIGDSQTYGNGGSPNAWFMWLLARLGGRIYMPYTANIGTGTAQGGNMAISGESTAQITARKSYFNAADCGVYVIMSGQNDGAGYTALQNIADYSDILDEPNLLGAYRVYVCPPPLSMTYAASPSLQTRRNDVEAWGLSPTGMRLVNPNARYVPIASLYNGIETTIQITTTNGSPNVTLNSYQYPPVPGQWVGAGTNGLAIGTYFVSVNIGAGTAVVSANANASSTIWVCGKHSSDGIHFNPLGAEAWSENFAAFVASDMAPGNIYTQGHTNLNTTSQMLGTGGSGTVGTPVTGTPGIATGYAASNSTGATVAWSKVVRGGKTYQRVEISGTASASSVVRLRRSVAVAFNTADVVEVAYRPVLSNIAGNGPAVGMKGWALSTAASSTARWMSAAYADATGPIGETCQWDYTTDGTTSQCWIMGTGAASFNVDHDIQVKTGMTLDIAFEWTDEEVYNRTAEGTV